MRRELKESYEHKKRGSANLIGYDSVRRRNNPMKSRSLSKERSRSNERLKMNISAELIAEKYQNMTSRRSPNLDKQSP